MNATPGQLGAAVLACALIAAVALALSMYLYASRAETAVEAVEANRVERETALCEVYELLVARPQDPRTGEVLPLPEKDNNRAWTVATRVRGVWIASGCGKLLRPGDPLPPPPDATLLRSRMRPGP